MIGNPDADSANHRDANISLSLWERPAEGRVRDLRSCESSDKSTPHPSLRDDFSQREKRMIGNPDADSAEIQHLHQDRSISQFQSHTIDIHSRIS
jgi:hypothetical protein